MARRDEYEADRIAGRLLGRDVAAAALLEIALKGDWLQLHFWREHWAGAARQALPVGPFQGMARLLVLPLPNGFAQQSLRRTMRRISDVDDTHPVLRDRLDALGVDAVVPPWSHRSAIGLLAQPQRWIARFDQQWCARHASTWKQHHAILAEARTRAEQLAARPRRNAQQCTELGDLQRLLGAPAAAQEQYRQALAQLPRHALALRGLFKCLPPAQQEQRLACLEQLHEAAPEQRAFAAQAAVAELEADPRHDEQVLRQWRARLKDAEAAEAQAGAAA